MAGLLAAGVGRLQPSGENSAATSDGVRVNFENVGGEVKRAMLSRMAIGECVVLCGFGPIAAGREAKTRVKVHINDRFWPITTVPRSFWLK
jgi:hypothetical protein